MGSSIEMGVFCRLKFTNETVLQLEVKKWGYFAGKSSEKGKVLQENRAWNF